MLLDKRNDITINHYKDGEIDIVELGGDIDLYNTPILREKIEEIEVTNKTKIILSLKDVTYIDSSGLGLLLKDLKNAKDKKIPYHFVEISSEVSHIFKTSGFKAICRIYPSKGEAIETLRNS